MKEPAEIIPCPTPTHKGFCNLTGHKYGKLTVIGLAGRKTQPNGANSFYWFCICECGEKAVIRGMDMRHGKTTSCGCVKLARITALKYSHGLSHSPENQVWTQMIQRCTNPKNKSFKNYGGRGIKVCDRWLNSFANFYADMGPRPSDEHSIDRTNNDGNYEPGNCQWVKRKAQSRNTRGNRLLTFDGETKCLVEWAEDCGIDAGVVRARIGMGWTVAKALIVPVASGGNANVTPAPIPANLLHTAEQLCWFFAGDGVPERVK